LHVENTEWMLAGYLVQISVQVGFCPTVIVLISDKLRYYI